MQTISLTANPNGIPFQSFSCSDCQVIFSLKLPAKLAETLVTIAPGSREGRREGRGEGKGKEGRGEGKGKEGRGEGREGGREGRKGKGEERDSRWW